MNASLIEVTPPSFHDFRDASPVASGVWRRSPLVLLLLASILFAGCLPSSTDSESRTDRAASGDSGAGDSGASDAATDSLALPKIRLTVVDDAPLAEAVERHWNARSAGEVVVRNIASAELLAAEHLNSDAVIYPSGLLGTLAERRWIVEFPMEPIDAAEYQRDEIFTLQRLHEPAWGKAIYAVSLGSPQLVLAYRRDIFERLKVQPPTTWAEYQTLVEQLGDRALLGELAPADDAAWTATVEPNDQGWAALMLLARAAPYARHRSQFSTLFNVRTMQPLIDGPPFTRALDEMRMAIGQQPATTPDRAWQRLVRGETAMAVTWLPATTDKSSDDSDSAAAANETGIVEPDAIGFAELPGAAEMYNFRNERWEPRGEDDEPRVPVVGIAGRLGSVCSVARSPRRGGLAGLDQRQGNEQRRFSGELGDHDVSRIPSATTQFMDRRAVVAPIDGRTCRRHVRRSEPPLEPRRAFASLAASVICRRWTKPPSLPLQATNPRPIR
ncbi:MAG: extracellular solute-binding protein [Pirellulaceae bacterium]